MPKRKLPYLSDEQLVGLCERFVRGEPPREIGTWLSRELHVDSITRQQVRYLLGEARHRNFLAVHPPRDMTLGQRVADIYRTALRGSTVAVVPARGASASEYVASEAATLVLGLIKRVAATRPRVHLGLGAGFTTRRLVQHLTSLLRADEAPPLTLHALTSGFQGDHPSVAPVAFFGLFDALELDIDYVGLFAQSVAPVTGYARLKREAGLREPFAATRDLDIVVTSLASAEDPHGTLNRYLADKAPSKALKRA